LGKALDGDKDNVGFVVVDGRRWVRPQGRMVERAEDDEESEDTARLVSADRQE